MSKEEKATPQTHDFTKVVNDAIAKSKSPFLKALTKDGPLVKYFHYCQNDEEQYFQAVGGKVFVPREISSKGFLRAYSKGFMIVRGSEEELSASLPADVATNLNARLRDILNENRAQGRAVNDPILQAFNQTLQEEIIEAVEQAGGPAINFEEDRATAGDFDSKVFVQVIFDGYKTPIERREAIRVSNAASKARRLGETAGRVDVTSGAEFSNAGK